MNPDTIESLRAWARALQGINRQPGHAITLEEHNALTANASMALTQSPMRRHKSSGNSHELGELL